MSVLMWYVCLCVTDTDVLAWLKGLLNIFT